MEVVGVPERSYNPHKIEENILEMWRKEKVYEEIRKKLNGKPKYYFLDGPPYPSSGVPHIGTVWNKVIKDLIIRFLRMRGFNVRDQPGYDTHGLPIEVTAERILNLKSKKDITEKIGVENFIKKCKDLALTNAREMSKRFENVGVSMDWDNPYYTLNSKYIELGWWLIKRAYERGLLAKGLRVVHWCPRCETVLADYEVTEYRDLEDPSIYVKLPVKGRDKEYILIWTTTPWTLPANTGVMVHPNLEYVRVEYKGEIYILAKARLHHVFEENLKTTDYKVLEVFYGRELEGLKYEPPLKDEVKAQRELLNDPNSFKIVLSEEYVTPYEGTGCVHTAPGHGHEDFDIGLRYNLPVISPVNSTGIYTEEAGKYAGMNVREANDEIIKDLKNKGLLLYHTRIVHKYPVCWRCKTPLIIRATEQWYIKVSQLKKKILEEAEKVEWIPEWALERFRNWIENLRDWVISRQRYWGTPLPIWECSNCKNWVVIGSFEELKRKAINISGKIDLHKPWIDEVKLRCERCGGVMIRVPDVMDVWFDSGISFYASLGDLKEWDKLKPVDFITEGHDQIAGWFFSLLRAGVIGFDRSPYRRVLVHGFMLDEKGREMHKSLGNYVEPDEVISKYGRDTLRLWLLQNTIWEDARFSWRSLDQVFRDLHVMWNVYVFASTYMNIDKFNPKVYTIEKLKDHLSVEDLWLLSRINRLVKNVTKSLEAFHIHEAARDIRRFIVEDVSHWYVRLVRRKVWIEEEVPTKLATYATLYYTLKKFLQLIAPFTPFISEELYQKIIKPAEPDLPSSIHMIEWPTVDEKWISKDLEEEMKVVMKIVEASLAARMKAGIKVRQPLPALYIISDHEEAKNVVLKYNGIIKEQVNVKNVILKGLGEMKEFRKYKITPVYKALGPVFKDRTKSIVKIILDEQDRIALDLLEKGEAKVKVDDEEYTVTKDMVIITEEPVAGFSVQEFDYGTLALDTKISEKELAEGLARDIVRRVQFMRKLLDLPVLANIKVYIKVPDEKAEALICEKKGYIMSEVRAIELQIDTKAPKTKDYDIIREWDIEGDKYIIFVKKER